MLRYAFAAGLLAVLVPGAPAFAVTAKEKMETCKFGADDQNLEGAARKSFMTKCMAKADAPEKKKPAAKPKPATPAAPPAS
jgi:hypothetical protein